MARMNTTGVCITGRQGAPLLVAAGASILLGLAVLASSQDVGPTSQPAIDPEQVRSTIEVLRQNPEQMQALIEGFQQNPQLFMGLVESARQNPEQAKAIMDDIRQNPGQAKSIVDRAASKNMQKLLGAPDDEWSVLEPKIAQVTSLQAQLRVAPQPFGMPFFFSATRPALAGQSKLRQLGAVVARLGRDKDAPPEEVSAALDSYRQAKVEVRASLAKAVAELTELLTPRQEAQLTLMRVLELP